MPSIEAIALSRKLFRRIEPRQERMKESGAYFDWRFRIEPESGDEFLAGTGCL